MSDKAHAAAVATVGKMVKDQLDIVLAILITIADGNKDDAIKGAEAVHSDMLRNIDRHFAQVKP